TGPANRPGAPVERAESAEGEVPHRTPRRVGRFAIERRLGGGAMGVVYLAWQDHPRRQVALKLMRPDRFNPAMLRRFEVEAQLLGRLQHPGIARIYDAGTCDVGEGATPYVAMEYVAGVTLATWAQSHAEPRAILSMLARVADAVEHAHRKGVIHRDLKPANIVVDPDDAPRILDFGVSRAVDDDPTRRRQTAAGEFVGTLPYMSPEQIAGDPDALDTRSDVYALGVIAYELLAGRLPHDLDSTTLAEAVRLVTQDDPAPLGRLVPALRGDVETIVGKALAKEPDRRYQSAADLAADIRRWLDDEPILARPQTTGETLLRLARRNKALVAVSAASLIAVVLFAVGMAAKAVEASGQRDRAVEAERVSERRRLAAEAEAAIARSVSEFLSNMLVSADPEQSLGESLTVRDVVDAAAAGVDGAFPGQPSVESSVRGTLGATYRGLGLFEKAEHQLEQAARLATSAFGPDDPRTIAANRVLGMVLTDQGRFDEAESLLFDAVQRLEAQAPQDEPALILARSDLARLRTEQGRLDEAAEMFRTTADDATRVLGPDDPATLTALHNLATTKRIQGDYEGAEELTRTVLEARRRTLGPDHPQTLYSGNALAAVLQRRGKIDEAEPLYRDTLAARCRILGTDHPSTNTVRQNLATLLIENGRLGEAEPLVLEVLQSCRRSLGPRHPRTLMALNMHAYLLEDLGQLEEAERAYRDAVELASTIFDASAPEWYPPQSNLASLLQRLGRLDEASDRFSELVAKAQANLPENQLYRCVIENNAGDCLRQAGRLDEAAPLLEGSLARFEAVLGADHPRTVKARTRLEALRAAERGEGG
ncbi:MAG: serine/threonine protein kinase, partial [Phycisphaerales bacterium]|nr:serine/threonine protein kinase [Phycisphaerales bacterium]